MRGEGLSNYVRGLTWGAYISEFGTADERNDGRAQETAAIFYIHMESFAEMDELRRESTIMTTAAFAALKRPGGGGGGGGAAGAMRAEKPEKMVPAMQALELIDEHKTRKNGDEMSWGGFKYTHGSYPGIKTTFNNYLNKHETDVVWRAKTQAEQVRGFITGFLGGFDDPGVRAKEAVARALRFHQKSQMPTSVYLELKELRFDEALREGNTAGHVDTRIRDEAERCRNAVENLLTPIETAVRDHLTDASLAGHVIVGYSMDHFTEWAVMAKQVRRLAIHKRLDPKSSSSVTQYGKNVMKAQDSESEGEQEGRKRMISSTRIAGKPGRRVRRRAVNAAAAGNARDLCSAAIFRIRPCSSKVMAASCRHAGRAVQRTISVSTTGTELVARRRALVFTAVT